MPEQVCTSCGVTRPLAEFYIDKRRGKPYTRCKNCCKARSKRWDERNPSRRSAISRASARRRHPKMYGLTQDAYEALMKNQGGVCAICREPETKVLYGCTCKLAIDHDHATGAVRGLVCSRCNSILGMAQDDATLLLNAIGYLSKHRSGPILWEKPLEKLTA